MPGPISVWGMRDAVALVFRRPPGHFSPRRIVIGELRFMLFALAAAAATLSAEPSAVPATRAAPMAELASLVRPADYPVSAIAARQEGQVRFLLDIDTLGRVDGCTIVKSAGSALLDRASCMVVTRRARFQPALDGDGAPVRDQFAGALDWKLP